MTCYIGFKRPVKHMYLALRNAVLSLCLRPEKIEDIRADIITSVLVIRIDRIGDVVVSLPAIKALRKIFPRAKISVMLKKEISPLLKSIPWIDELIPYNGFWGSSRILARRRFNMAVDLLMDYTLRTAFLGLFSGARLRAGFDIEGRGRFFNIAVKPQPEKKSMSSHLMDLVRSVADKAGSDKALLDDEPARLVIPDNDKDYADNLFSSHGMGADDIIVGIHPGGNYLSQLWPEDRFIELARRISDIYKAKIAIIGSMQDENLVGRIAAKIKTRSVPITGLTLDKLAAIISRMDLLVCNNSGPLHIAAALCVATVSTMGPTAPELWWPDGDRHIVVRKSLPCSPCGLAVCGRHDCMKAISVEDMMKAVAIQIGKAAKTLK
jgi:heptosyltransferase-2